MKKKNQAAVSLGSIKTKKKARSSKENGKKGGYPKGRPRKICIHTFKMDDIQSVGKAHSYTCIKCSVKAVKDYGKFDKLTKKDF